MMSVYPPVTPPEYQKAMVFIDGTNLFERLKAHRLVVSDQGLMPVLRTYLRGRKILRAYLYTSEHRLIDARARHGDTVTTDLRVVLGQSVPTGTPPGAGNPKEKGVDALLVADLIYHAAVKNLDYAVVVSVDTDFLHAVKRVEDFGARTAVMAIADRAPPRLVESADEYMFVPADDLVRSHSWKTK